MYAAGRLLFSTIQDLFMELRDEDFLLPYSSYLQKTLKADANRFALSSSNDDNSPKKSLNLREIFLNGQSGSYGELVFPVVKKAMVSRIAGRIKAAAE
jgi:hypothetical protein